jgi:hypothetical protein
MPEDILTRYLDHVVERIQRDCKNIDRRRALLLLDGVNKLYEMAIIEWQARIKSTETHHG